MKPIHILLTLCLSTLAPGAGAALSEPATSLMANGHWVKVRVQNDAVYELTYDELRGLGFSNPEKVCVFGYNPTLLLTHNDGKIPADMAPIYTLHSSAHGKILFYGKGDTDFAPELWELPATQSYHHVKHMYSPGATYFLSDVDCEQPELSRSEAPLMAEGLKVLTDHTSLVYHEEDLLNIAEGGCWFTGLTINSARSSETHSFEITKPSASAATLVYSGMMSPTSRNKKNILLASLSGNITSEAATGNEADILPSHTTYTRSMNRQNLNIPLTDGTASYDVTFTIHPEAAPMENGAMLDFFGLLYKRDNNVSGSTQLHMYFENWDAAKPFSLTGMQTGDWRVWNVQEPMTPVEFDNVEEGGVNYYALKKAVKYYPNDVIAFNVAATQPKPEVISAVANQNLHALEVPDLVIVTNRLFHASAEKIAALHKRLRGLDVAVVDQQQIFNEYSSGNISAEGVRRFMSHMYSKNPEKLKGLLLLGPATYNQALQINDDAPYVVTAECEYYAAANKVTTAYASDTFFGRFDPLVTSGNWAGRGEQLQIMASTPKVAVGRVPLMSASEIDAYYRKVEEYITRPDDYCGLGNVLMASDYSSANEEHHLTNAESIASTYGDKAGKSITITRAASNLISAKDNAMVKSITKSALSRGASFFAYFGHGSTNSISGSNTSVDFLFDLNTTEKLITPGKYPLVYFGTCKVGPYDRTPNNLSNRFLSNANGGAIAVIASGREVFQKQNQELCQYLVQQLQGAESGTWLGNIWCMTQQQGVDVHLASRDNIINHLTYNFLGDPTLPYYGETHNVSIPQFASMIMTGKNTLSGTVNTLDGNIDKNFNGKVKLYFYDVPELRKNILGNVSSSVYSYVSEVTLDQEIIGEAVGDVRNGNFNVEFFGPVSVKKGTHRIQAYAYSSDGTSRGLGYIDNVAFTDPAGETEQPGGEPTEIRKFAMENGALEAEIYIPSGTASTSLLKSPVMLTIDGETISHVNNIARYEDGGICRISYPLRNPAHGRHTAKISVLDAMGVWTDAECEFSSINIPESTLSASVDGTKVNFEIVSTMANNSEKRLIVEHLNGEPALIRNMASNMESVDLPAGAYRAYVQIKSASAASSTPKVEVFVD